MRKLEDIVEVKLTKADTKVTKAGFGSPIAKEGKLNQKCDCKIDWNEILDENGELITRVYGILACESCLKEVGYV